MLSRLVSCNFWWKTGAALDEKTRCLNRLTQRLKLYFPQVLSWFGSVDSLLVWRFLEQWPDLESLRKARRSTLRAFLERDRRCSPPAIEELWPAIRDAIPATHDAAVIASSILFVKTTVRQLQLLHEAIREYGKRIEQLTETHPDFPLVHSFPGVGKALAPRLIAALGTHRDRFGSANELQSYSGIAPVQECSGKQCWIHVRRACPKFVRQTFQEWAQHSLASCEWARAYYDQHLARGKQHHAIIRSLAFKWIRILYRCWQNHTPYREAAYLPIFLAGHQLLQRLSKSCGKRPPAFPKSRLLTLDLPAQMSPAHFTSWFIRALSV